MRITLALLLALLSPSLLKAEEHHVSNLTANELAEALDIHWWVVKIPSNLGPKDSVGISLVSSDGKEVAVGTSISSGPGKIKLGELAKIFCWEEKASGHMKLKLEVAGTVGSSYAQDYFNNAACGGPENGSVLNPGDILLKFDSSKSPSITGGNALLPGQFGLKVVINRG
jgi:hypothetical protein